MTTATEQIVSEPTERSGVPRRWDFMTIAEHEEWYRAMRAGELCHACRQAQSTPSCDQREHWGVTPATITPAELLQTPEGFRRWLDAQEATDIVGAAESLHGCPIARFLGARGVELPSVGPQFVRWDSVLRDAPRDFLPAWARAFVHAIDTEPWRPVTAAHARALLHQCERVVA